MTDEATITQPASGDAQPSTPPEEPVVAQVRTVEEVEAEYRARISGKDRESQALRDENARLKEAEAKRQAVAEAQRAVELGEAEALKRQLAEERALRVIETRQAKYPKAAETLGDDVLATIDEAKLAGLEVRLGAGAPPAAPPPRVDPNSPPRNPANGTPAPQTADDLKDQLARLAPDFVQSLRNQ